jgi:hypothetical protein
VFDESNLLFLAIYCQKKNTFCLLCAGMTCALGAIRVVFNFNKGCFVLHERVLFNRNKGCFDAIRD